MPVLTNNNREINFLCLFYPQMPIAVAVNSQDRGTCFSNMGCTGTVTQSGLVEDLGEFCCPYSSPGVTMALSYQFIGSEHCFTCPRSKFN